MNKEALDQFIRAQAEALANLQSAHPTEADFVRAEHEVQAMLAEGWSWGEDNGWHPPEPPGPRGRRSDV